MKKTNFSDFLDNFFSFASPVIIILPLITIVLALILSFSQPKSIDKKESLEKIISPTLTIKKNKTIDLNGPYICDYQNNQASISAFIKNKKVFVQIKEEIKTIYVFLDSDCLYYWQGFNGQKICGLSPLLMLFNSFSTTIDQNFFSNLNFLNEGNNQTFREKIDFQKLIDQCQNQDFDDNKIFVLPKNVLFENKDLNQIMKKNN